MDNNQERWKLCFRCLEIKGTTFMPNHRKKLEDCLKNNSPWQNPLDVLQFTRIFKKGECSAFCRGCSYIMEHTVLAQKGMDDE